MNDSLIRVLSVEDNQLVAEAIARKLETNPGFEWMGWVDSMVGLQQAVAERHPTVVCMDLQMPGQDPFEMVIWLREHCPSTRVLMLTGHVQEDQIDKALAAGAWGYLSKAEESGTILDGIRRVAVGEFVLGIIAKKEFRGTVPACPIGPNARDAALQESDDGMGTQALQFVRRIMRRFSASS